MHELAIRPASQADVSQITSIYNHYVATTTVTFDRDAKSPEDRSRWLTDRLPEHPVLVAEVEGSVVGWGSVSPYGKRASWKHTVELGVYLDPETTGRGVGSAILGKLIEECRRIGHHALMAQIVTDNAASLAMAERAGFERVGTLREVGRKFGRWLDVAVLELRLADSPDPEEEVPSGT